MSIIVATTFKSWTRIPQEIRVLTTDVVLSVVKAKNRRITIHDINVVAITELIKS